MQSSNKVDWTQNYADGVPARLDLGEDTFIGVVDEAMKRFASRPAVDCLGVVWSYGELDEKCSKMAAALQSLGLSDGARIAIMMPTLSQYLVVFLGAIRAGYIPVGVNPLYTPRELEHQLNDSGAEAIFILEDFAHTLEEALPNVNVKHIFVTSAGDVFGGFKGQIVNFVLRNIKKTIAKWKIPAAKSYSAFLAKHKSSKFKSQSHSPDDIAVLQYTGGTTGVSKGAVLTQRNLLAAGRTSGVWLKPALQAEPRIEEPVFLLPLPLYHIFTVYSMSMGLSIGAKAVLIPNPRDLDGLVKTMAKSKFTMMIGLNTLYQGILNHKDVGDIDFSNARAFIAGGAATHQSVADDWKKLTNKPILEGWGMTETTGAGTCNPYPIEKFSGTIGLPMPSIDISIRDDDGNEVATGDLGEIWIKGPNVMQGYWQRPKETKEAFDDNGYLATGDIGFMDEKGFISIVDRKKDMILVSGFNVFCNEIENVVSGLDGVAEVAAIGVPDSKTGEAVKVFIVKGSDTLTKDKIQAFCREEMTGYKRPKHIEFIDQLPKSPVGKILRKDLRAQ